MGHRSLPGWRYVVSVFALPISVDVSGFAVCRRRESIGTRLLRFHTTELSYEHIALYHCPDGLK